MQKFFAKNAFRKECVKMSLFHKIGDIIEFNGRAENFGDFLRRVSPLDKGKRSKSKKSEFFEK
ncbi:MAG: hypothetical protein DRR08_31965 [Candidatus Parabeggiatoa sp. nov. 2]|nr:MAG: hypothetical protein DRR08_31965 [Gammaproteobacteria bacterium]